MNNSNHFETNDVNINSELAVNVNNVFFGFRRNANVLNGLNVFVPKGHIFALLGPNGCGKTTLMRALLGRVKIRSGSIQVFNMTPGSRKSDVPGVGVGYMPQELALFDDFTIDEILTYYAMIYHMKSERIVKRIEYLINLLNLPEKSRPISRLSGGQQRRVSIAITLIHRPKLIILDEPTVGVDSLLRQKIWQYLHYICQKKGQTVIITTHYIEEAKSAANVAFMTNGSVLRQENPQKLLQEYNTQTLEEVFLILCQQRIKRRKSQNICLNDNNYELNRDLEKNISNKKEIRSKVQYDLVNTVTNIQYNRIKAMLWKYYMLTMKNPMLLLIYFLTPVLTLLFMLYTIGRGPTGLPVAVFNEDHNPWMSNLFLNSFDKNYVHLNEYKDEEKSIESVVKGHNHLSLVFAENFSDIFEYRLKDVNSLLKMDELDIEDGMIRVYFDFSDAVIGAFLLKYLMQTFSRFLDALSAIIGFNAYRVLVPVQVQEVIYGELNLDYTNQFSPAWLLLIVHLLPLVLSALQIATDRKNSSFERVFVAGVKPIEYFIAHMILHTFLMLIMAFTCMAFMFYIMRTVLVGSIVEVFAILSMQGMIGIAIGLMIALIFADDVSVAIVIFALTMPYTILSGVLWPVESIPANFRIFSDMIPLTLPLDALRSIILRGWTYQMPSVLLGYIISVVYFLSISALNIILFQFFIGSAFTINSWRIGS